MVFSWFHYGHILCLCYWRHCLQDMGRMMTENELKAARIKEANRRTNLTLSGDARCVAYSRLFYDNMLTLADWNPVDPWEERAEKIWAETYTFFNTSDRRNKGSNEDSAAILAIKAALIEAFAEGKSAAITEDARGDGRGIGLTGATALVGGINKVKIRDALF
jgi:hypothetical protein